MEEILIGELIIAVTRKRVKNVHLTVHPPDWRVTMTVPMATRLEVARAYAITRLGWIRALQERLRGQARETPRQYVERESHYVWGRRCLLSVIERDERPLVKLEPGRITLIVRPGSSAERRAEVLGEWHRQLLRQELPGLIAKWEGKLGVCVKGCFVQRMKTKWGGCNHRAGTIRLNSELVKKPKDLLQYVVVHEMLHLIEPRHRERFSKLLDRYYPTWREARRELNELPLGG
jgi:predicted metal-dependent hydrolase